MKGGKLYLSVDSWELEAVAGEGDEISGEGVVDGAGYGGVDVVAKTGVAECLRHFSFQAFDRERNLLPEYALYSHGDFLGGYVERLAL